MPESLFVEFPPVSPEEWEAAIARDLKGTPPPPGKLFYTAADAQPVHQPWPEMPWQIWAEVRDLASARRAIERGVQGLVVEHDDAAIPGVPFFNRSTRTLSTGVPVIEFAHHWSIERQISEARLAPSRHALVVPVSPAYFHEIAKFRALRRIRPDHAMIIARTSAYYQTAYDPHVNLLRATTEAMAAILGGCDALIVGPFDEARGDHSELAERLAINTQLLLREEAGLGHVADPSAGSWYIESLTAALVQHNDSAVTAVPPPPVLIGVNRYPNPNETSPPAITDGRAATRLERCRLRSDQYTERTGQRPSVHLILGSDPKMSRARAAFARSFFTAVGFDIADASAPLAILCDADANYPALAAAIHKTSVPILIAGSPAPLDGVAGFINANSDHAAIIEFWQEKLGIK